MRASEAKVNFVIAYNTGASKQAGPIAVYLDLFPVCSVCLLIRNCLLGEKNADARASRTILLRELCIQKSRLEYELSDVSNQLEHNKSKLHDLESASTAPVVQKSAGAEWNSAHCSFVKNLRKSKSIISSISKKRD